MELCGFHCITRYSIGILVNVPMYFTYFNALLCGLQGVPVVINYQMGSDMSHFSYSCKIIKIIITPMYKNVKSTGKF